jgi:molecular chaperone DnaK (HSP70)
MYVTAKEAAEECGITVEKLEKIARNKRCLVGIKNDQGFYDPEVVQTMLDRQRKAKEAAKRYYQRNKSTQCKSAIKHPTKSTTSKRRTETPEEYQERFWTEEDRWKDFMLKDINKENYKEWMEYFIGEALAFGYDTAYPHTVVHKEAKK